MLAGAALAALVGCSNDHPNGHVDKAPFRVTERDFRISAPKRVSAGNFEVSVHNKGPDDHEFILVRLRGKSLPLRPDGLTVDEDAIEDATAGALEPSEVGVRDLRVHLKPGRYELLCNMYGHYAGGMHTKLVVSS